VSYEVSFVLYNFGEHFNTTRSGTGLLFLGKVACLSTIHQHYVMTLLQELKPV